MPRDPQVYLVYVFFGSGPSADTPESSLIVSPRSSWDVRSAEDGWISTERSPLVRSPHLDALFGFDCCKQHDGVWARCQGRSCPRFFVYKCMLMSDGAQGGVRPSHAHSNSFPGDASAVTVVVLQRLRVASYLLCCDWNSCLWVSLAAVGISAVYTSSQGQLASPLTFPGDPALMHVQYNVSRQWAI